MLKSIEIKRFRGIRNLTLDNLGKVNILVGHNAAGKTSVLEAISIAATPTGVRRLMALSEWREMVVANREQDDALRAYFYDLNLDAQPTISFTADEHSGIWRLKAMSGTWTSAPTDNLDGDLFSASASDYPSRIRGVTVEVESLGKRFESKLELGSGGFTAEENDAFDKLGCFYVHARRSTSVGETARLLTSLREQKRESDLVDILRRVDSRVTQLWPGVKRNSTTILVDIGLPRMIPMNLMGDGFCRATLIATGMLFRSKVMVVDEIDSGLHHSVMESLWKAILGLTANKQLFCATHSEEMLRATLHAFEDDQEALRVIRVERSPDGEMSAITLPYEQFSLASRADLEVR